MNFADFRRVSIQAIISALSLLSMFVLFGCNRGSDNTGTYLYEKNPKVSVELKSDKTFKMQFGDKIVDGKYVIDGKQVSFTSQQGKVTAGIIDGKTITDNVGAHWTKK